MDTFRLWFLLLLTLCDSEDFLVKRIRQKAEVTPVCNSSHTVEFITLLVCKIRTERSRAEPCSLVYKYDGRGFSFDQGCGSSFFLTGNNQTVFLRFHDLTAADSGNITCSCAYQGRVHSLHLSITVEDSEDEEGDMIIPTVICASVSVAFFLMLASVMLVFIRRKQHQRKQPDAVRKPPDMDFADVGPYSTFIPTEAGLYSVVRLHCS